MFSTRRVGALLVMVAILVAGAATAEASNIRITETETDGVTRLPYKSTSGGEYTAYDYTYKFASISNEAWYDYNGNGKKDEFQTFCLEGNEPVLDKDLVCYTLGKVAYAGGKGVLGRGGPHDFDGVDGVSDPLSYASAYLFDAFYRGKLGKYNYADVAPGPLPAPFQLSRADSALALQYAFWLLEDDKLGVSGSDVGSQASAWVAEAIAAVDGAWGKTYGLVRVMSIIDPVTGDKIQDQLVLVPLPGAAWAGLAMLGALGMVRTIRRRRLAQ